MSDDVWFVRGSGYEGLPVGNEECHIINHEMKPQTPRAKGISCWDCIYRDKTIYITDDRREIPTGVTKDICEMYSGKMGRFKPNEVLFQNKECFYYISVHGLWKKNNFL